MEGHVMDRTENTLEELIPVLRKFTCDHLESGTRPEDLSYALVLVATELGLCVTDGALQVVPAVLKGLSDAIGAFAAETDAAIDLEGDTSTDADVEVQQPNNAVIH
jgi:hypothetical protein